MQVPGRTESRGRAPRTGCSAAIVSLASVFVAKVPLGSAFLLFYQGPDWRCAEATRLSSVGFDWFAQDIQRCSTILSNFAYPRFQGYAARPPGCVPLEPRVRSTPPRLRSLGTEGTQHPRLPADPWNRGYAAHPPDCVPTEPRVRNAPARMPTRRLLSIVPVVAAWAQ